MTGGAVAVGRLVRITGDWIDPETPEDKSTATVLTEKVQVFDKTCSSLNGRSCSETSTWKN